MSLEQGYNVPSKYSISIRPLAKMIFNGRKPDLCPASLILFVAASGH